MWRYTYFLMLHPVIEKLNNFIKLLIMVMVKIATLENFSISSKFARENLYYSYFYHHHHHCLLRKAMETGKFFSCLCVLYQPFERREIIDAHLEDWNALNNILWYIDILWYLAFCCYNKKLNRLRVWGLKFYFFLKIRKLQIALNY